MTNREKIIVGLAALALGYGAIELLLPRANVAPVTAAAEPGGVERLHHQGGRCDPGRHGRSRRHRHPESGSRLEAGPLPRDPESQGGRSDSHAPHERTARLPNLVYNGFIELGSKRLAIINGQEYEAGDKLSPGGFTIKSILPTRVVIVSAQGEGAPIVLPLQESE